MTKLSMFTKCATFMLFWCVYCISILFENCPKSIKVAFFVSIDNFVMMLSYLFHLVKLAKSFWQGFGNLVPLKHGFRKPSPLLQAGW